MVSTGLYSYLQLKMLGLCVVWGKHLSMCAHVYFCKITLWFANFLIGFFFFFGHKK